MLWVAGWGSGPAPNDPKTAFGGISDQTLNVNAMKHLENSARSEMATRLFIRFQRLLTFRSMRARYMAIRRKGQVGAVGPAYAT